MTLPHLAFDWLRHCLSVFTWFFLMLPSIDCSIVYLYSHGSSSCCLGLSVASFICVLMMFLMLPWIDCDIVYLCSHGSSLCCLVTLICVLMVLPRVALDWLWDCLSVFSWLFLMLPWIECGIVYLCVHGSSSCCIGLIVILFICVLMGLPHAALDYLWHYLSVFSWFSSCCLELIVTLFMVLPHVAFDWLWH